MGNITNNLVELRKLKIRADKQMELLIHAVSKLVIAVGALFVLIAAVIAFSR